MEGRSKGRRTKVAGTLATTGTGLERVHRNLSTKLRGSVGIWNAARITSCRSQLHWSTTEVHAQSSDTKGPPVEAMPSQSCMTAKRGSDLDLDQDCLCIEHTPFPLTKPNQTLQSRAFHRAKIDKSYARRRCSEHGQNLVNVRSQIPSFSKLALYCHAS